VQLLAFLTCSYLLQAAGSFIAVYHDDAFAPGKAQIARPPSDAFLLRNLVQSSDVWIQTRSLRAQMTGEVCNSVGPAVKSVCSVPSILTGHCAPRTFHHRTRRSGKPFCRAAITVQTGRIGSRIFCQGHWWRLPVITSCTVERWEWNCKFKCQNDCPKARCV
jgi:hypothetical protein